MSSVRAEYQRFLHSSSDRTVSEDTRRLANLVLGHLENLAEVGATRRARSLRLAPLAVRHLSTTSSQLPMAQMPAGNAELFGRLHELRVGPSRGFMRPEVSDLSQSITLVYGANGTGKSSFCEALEIALLGSISEAQAKRIDARDYCKKRAPERSAITLGAQQQVPKTEAGVTTPSDSIGSLAYDSERFGCAIRSRWLD